MNNNHKLKPLYKGICGEYSLQEFNKKNMHTFEKENSVVKARNIDLEYLTQIFLFIIEALIVVNIRKVLIFT